VLAVVAVPFVRSVPGHGVLPGEELRPPLVEQGDPLLDAAEGLDEVAFEPDEDVDGVLVRAAADAVGVALGALDDPAALLVGSLGEAALVDEERRLFLGAGDDPLGLLLRLLDDPLALGIDPLRGTDLLRDRGAELVDEAEGGILVDDDVVGERKLLSVREQRLEALDEEDDVDRSDLPGDGGRSPARLGDYRTGSGCRNRAASARAAAGGTSEETSPPNVAISRARLELT
jgi:hypothetical protein